MELIKKYKIVIGVAVLIIVAALGVWYFVLGKSAPNPQTSVEEQNVKQIQPEDIGLELKLKSDGKAVIMTLNKLSGIKTIEYEISYDAEEIDPESAETASVPKGVVGSPIEVNGQSEIEREILLGTCSANKCRYDNVKSDIKLVVKVTYTNGEIASAELTLPYSSE